MSTSSQIKPDAATADETPGHAPGLTFPHTRLSRIIDAVTNAVGGLVNWIWIILVMIIVVNVIMRYALGVNYIWVEEVQWHMYAVGFMVIMQAFGLNLAWTALLALPAVLLIAFGFASLGMAITSYMKTFQQIEWVTFIMLPMFLFSATFYPITVYPEAIQWVIQALPLWHAVELVRGLTTGALSAMMFVHIGYYLVMIAIGIVFTTSRLRALFLK